jgi:hypothetical protein
MAFALGKGGQTRKKLVVASGCVMDYLHSSVAYLCGPIFQRNKAEKYLYWLLDQRSGEGELRADKEIRSMPDVSVTEFHR